MLRFGIAYLKFVLDVLDFKSIFSNVLLHPEASDILASLNIELYVQGNVQTNHFQIDQEGIFAAGNMCISLSLVVDCLNVRRAAALAIDTTLMGITNLKSKQGWLMFSS